MMRKSLVVGAAIAWCTVAAAEQPTELRAEATAILRQAFQADGPGAAAIITKDGRTLWVGAVGLADVAAREPITPDTVFRLGSITKQFTAAMILQLVEEGRVKLDQPIGAILPDLPAAWGSVTVRQLLNHSSGVPSYTDLPTWALSGAAAKPTTTRQLIDLTREQPLHFAPGTEFRYSNTGYVLLGAIVEQIDGRSWYRSLEERITRPLRLSSIRYGVGEEGISAMAKGYAVGGQRVDPAQIIHMSNPHAAGALIGTVGDLARWNSALVGGRVVKESSYRQMVTPGALPNGTPMTYGFGLVIGEVRGRRAVGHGGGIFGFATDSLYVPSDKLFVAVFHNAAPSPASPNTVMLRLAALAMGDPFPAFTKQPVDLPAVRPLLGTYKLEQGQRVFFERDGRLFTRRDSGPEMEVFPAGQNRFFYGPESLSWFEMSTEAAGVVTMTFYPNGARQGQRSVRSD